AGRRQRIAVLRERRPCRAGCRRGLHHGHRDDDDSDAALLDRTRPCARGPRVPDDAAALTKDERRAPLRDHGYRAGPHGGREGGCARDDPAPGCDAWCHARGGLRAVERRRGSEDQRGRRQAELGGFGLPASRGVRKLDLPVASLARVLALRAALAMRVRPREPDDQSEPTGEEPEAEGEVARHSPGPTGIGRASMARWSATSRSTASASTAWWKERAPSSSCSTVFLKHLAPGESRSPRWRSAFELSRPTCVVMGRATNRRVSPPIGHRCSRTTSLG